MNTSGECISCVGLTELPLISSVCNCIEYAEVYIINGISVCQCKDLGDDTDI